MLPAEEERVETFIELVEAGVRDGAGSEEDVKDFYRWLEEIGKRPTCCGCETGEDADRADCGCFCHDPDHPAYRELPDGDDAQD